MSGLFSFLQIIWHEVDFPLKVILIISLQLLKWWILLNHFCKFFNFFSFAILFHKSNPIKNANGLIHHLEDWTIFTNFLWYINNTTYRANIPFRKLLYSLVSNLSQSPEICMSEPAFWFFWQKGSSCNDGIRTPVACVTSHCLNHYTNGSSYLIECRELIINDARDVSRRRVTFWRVNHLWLRTNSTCCNGTLFLTSP